MASLQTHYYILFEISFWIQFVILLFLVFSSLRLRARLLSLSFFVSLFLVSFNRLIHLLWIDSTLRFVVSEQSSSLSLFKRVNADLFSISFLDATYFCERTDFFSWYVYRNLASVLKFNIGVRPALINAV